ncbi:aminoglycoside phosphotransferase family protein [Cellulomonas hominis]
MHPGSDGDTSPVPVVALVRVGLATPAALPLPRALREGAGRTTEGAAWLRELPALVAAAARRWELTLGDPFESGSAAWTAPARSASGLDGVLKVVFPHDEARDEAPALHAWAGRGAVRLVADDRPGWCLLLERVRPGQPMSHAGGRTEDLLLAAAGAHAALTAVPPPGDPARPGWDELATRVRSMVTVSADWAHLIEERAARAVRGRRAGSAVAPGGADRATAPLAGLDRGLVRQAVALLHELSTTGPARVVAHGDFNPGNLLRGPHGAWLAIDPKPLRGDPAYDLWPLLSQLGDPFRLDDPGPVLRARTVLVAGAAGLDPARVAAWATAREVEAALWDWDRAGDTVGAEASLARAGVWSWVADRLG